MPAAEVSEKELAETASLILQRLAAGETYKDIGKLGDREMEAVYAMAHTLFEGRKFAKAAALFKFLCLAEHTNPRWWYALGVAHQQDNRLDAAVNAFAMATLLDVDDPRPQAQAGYCLLASGKLAEAQSALEGALLCCQKATDPAAVAAVAAQAEELLAAARRRLADAAKGE